MAFESRGSWPRETGFCSDWPSPLLSLPYVALALGHAKFLGPLARRQSKRRTRLVER